KPAPKKEENTCSRTSPRIRLPITATLTIPADRAIDCGLRFADSLIADWDSGIEDSPIADCGFSGFGFFDCGLGFWDCGLSLSATILLFCLLACSFITSSLHIYNSTIRNRLILRCLAHITTRRARIPKSAIRNLTGSPQPAKTLSPSECAGGSRPGRKQ